MIKEDDSTSNKLDHEKVNLIIHQHINKQNIQGNTLYLNPNFKDSEHLYQHINKKSQFQSFQYSMKQNQSLHSYFSSDQVEHFQSDKNQSMNVQQPQSLKAQLNNFQIKQNSSDEEYNIQDYREEVFTKFSKHKQSQDIFQAQILKLHPFENNDQKQIPGKQNRKTYTSYLHQAVQKNHLESPSKQKNVIGSQQSIQSPDQKNKAEQTKPTEQNNNQKGQSPEKQILKKKISQEIKPIQPQQQKPTTTKDKLRIQPRMIPSELGMSYDQLNLSVNKNQKKSKGKGKDGLNSPIKLKQKSKNFEQQKLNQIQKSKRTNRQTSNTIKTNFNEQLFASLSILQGFCQVKPEDSSQIETKFVMIKNTIVFQSFKRLSIESITKIKFIEKDQQQITIKICHQSNPIQKPEVIVVNVLSASQETYFSQSYQFFAHIILRKLLLMNLTINQVNQQKYLFPNKSPLSSPMSSPMNSPMSLPSSLMNGSGRASELSPEQSIDICKCQLYKKSTFFSSWEKKYFTISSSKGLRSFSSAIGLNQKQKPSSQLQKTSEIWTRFELIYGYLNVKMWQNKIQKIQIGIPLCDFTNNAGQQNWLFTLCKYIVWKNNNQTIS